MGRLQFLRLILLICIASGAAAWLDDVLSFSDTPFVQPGCDVMFSPGQFCFPHPAPFVKSCCTPGFECKFDPGSLFGHSCQPVQSEALSYNFASVYGSCSNKVVPGGQCGGGGGACKNFKQCAYTGPWNDFCCPDGFSCQPDNQEFRTWTCKADVANRPPVDASKEILRYPPRPLPSGACTCRVDAAGDRVPTDCPSPWDNAVGTKAVAPPIKIGPKGRFIDSETGEDVVLRGVNWYGWNVGQYNFDGLWAFCDDNYTASDPPCQPDGDIPPHYPDPAIGEQGIAKLGGIRFWGKRTMTNDFATVVYRMKLLGFNAVRVPFTFSDLNDDIPPPSAGKTEFFPCMADPDAYIAVKKTMDPKLLKTVKRGVPIDYPIYTGPQHPPPNNTGNAKCDLPWEAPFAPSYKGGDGSLKLTMCNWYLPQGENVPAIQRLLWQVQYMASQGLYVILAFASARDSEPNVANPDVLTQNWANLWKALRDLPNYRHIKGRVLADLASDPSRWGCQWDRECTAANSTSPSCAPGVWMYASAASAIHAVDPEVPVLIEGMGQDSQQRTQYAGCSTGSYPGLKWGDGFITNPATVSRYQLSDPSGMFAYDNFKQLGPITISKPAMPNQVVMSPHLYPSSITGVPANTEDEDSEVTWKWDQSWGWKALGKDKTSTGKPLRDVALLIGEFGTADDGDNSVNNTDTTAVSKKDRAWLRLLSRYLNALSWQNGPASWMWWSWNANSGDTKGIVGPLTTWREVQWTKVRLLSKEFGLVPWFCLYVSPEFCVNTKW